MDNKVIEELKELGIQIRREDDDYEIYNYFSNLKKLWVLLIEKSIKCLRYFDKREPFLNNNEKKPQVYGVDELEKYYDKYTLFEDMLYGSNRFYRDHVVHVVRTWMLGMECLLRNNGEYLDKIKIADSFEFNNQEKISIWTIIALTHDLGYPLETAQKIINKTKDMMYSFVSNPNIAMDLSFSGVQNNMNDFVVRFLSSRMQERKMQGEETMLYVARLQPKYYFKFQKSLESMAHGIVSAIIIYKLLIYFLESDYNINEDYTFSEEDVRQFYIRRDILRSIASHTCRDIYHLYIGSFAFLLIVVDDCQEWGRKSISELYIKSEIKNELQNINFSFDEENRKNCCVVSEKFKMPDDKEPLKILLRRLKEQSTIYIKLFRDGQDTSKRDFIFSKNCIIEYESNPKIDIAVRFDIFNRKEPAFSIEIKHTGNKKTDSELGQVFFQDVFQNIKLSESVDEKTTYNIPLTI